MGVKFICDMCGSEWGDCDFALYEGWDSYGTDTTQIKSGGNITTLILCSVPKGDEDSCNEKYIRENDLVMDCYGQEIYYKRGEEPDDS